jgi:putative colanic acid biosysnthesis UDP-glucose lipid carrier transferase
VATDNSNISLRDSVRHDEGYRVRAPRSQRLLRDRQTLMHWLQWLANTGVVLGLLYILTMRHLGHFPTDYKFLAVTTTMLMLVLYQSMGIFRRFSGTVSGAFRISRAWLLVLAGLLAVAFVTKTTEQYSRYIIGSWAISALAAQIALYFLAQSLTNFWQRRMQVNLPTLIVGSGHVARHLATSINRNPFLPDQVIGLVDNEKEISSGELKGIPLVGSIDRLPELIEGLAIDRIYVALPVERSTEIAQIQRALLEHNVDVIWAPDIFSFNLLNHCVREVAGVPLISLSESPLSSGGRAYLKTLMDVTLALLAVTWLSPVLLLCALGVKLTSRGPVIFKQRRHGWDGSVFEVWKFRSMYVHDEGDKVTQAKKDDARITPVGRFLRRTSLDELPQLFNVIGGTMSLVGPRPHAISHNLEYSQQISAYMARHRVKPGITGLAQIHGYRGETDSVEKMIRRVQLDLEYINNWSLGLDLWILIRTPFSLLSDNAY